MRAADQHRAQAAMDGLVSLWTSWDANGTGFADDAPRPTPVLRVRPNV
jgi:hypothetical protein